MFTNQQIFFDTFITYLNDAPNNDVAIREISSSFKIVQKIQLYMFSYTWDQVLYM